MIMLKPQKVLNVTKLNIENLAKTVPLQMMSEKFDGVWAACIIKNGEVLGLHTRTPSLITSMPHIAAQMQDIARVLETKGKTIAVIGELWKPDTKFKFISGEVRRTNQTNADMLFMTHDCVDLNNLSEEYVKRYTTYAQAATLAKEVYNCPNIHIVKQLAIGTTEYERYAAEAWQLGKEGVICRNPKAGYDSGSRNMNMFKVKENLDFDLEVIGVQEGKGKFSGMVGKLVCRDNAGRVFNVGGGKLTTQERQDIWDDLPNFNGSLGVAEIKCMRVQPDGDMREAYFNRWRQDKTLAEIQEVK